MSKRTNRRGFLRDSLLIGAGAAGGGLAPQLLRSVLPSDAKAAVPNGAESDGAEARLRELGIKLPTPPKPVAVYVPAVRVGNTLYASGHGPRAADGKLVQGKVGGELTLEQGYAAARLVGLNMLASVRNTLGSLDKVVRLVKVLGMVNCTRDFTKQPQVINGFSELMVQVFGETNGKAARSAVGVVSLPSNITGEIEAIFQIRS